MPLAFADDTPARRIKLRPRPAIQQVSAEQTEERTQKSPADRWSELKSKYAREAAAIPQARTASRPPSPTPIRPIPEDAALDEDEDADFAPNELQDESVPTLRSPAGSAANTFDEPLPITGYEQPPDWILGDKTALPEEPEAEEDDADEAGDLTPKRLVRRNLEADAEPKPAAAKPEPETFADEKPAAPKEADEPQTPSGTDAGYTPMPSGTRRPRLIKDISPRYDREVDRDIRDFAKQQASQYGLEFGKGVYEPRQFYGMAYQWEASNLYHYPLYFEDPQLERYGHTYGPVAQPIASIARFSGQLLMLPYQMTIDPICCPKYTLGWYRPGDCAPYLHYQVPLNAQAAAVEAGVITGLFFLIP